MLSHEACSLSKILWPVRLRYPRQSQQMQPLDFQVNNHRHDSALYDTRLCTQALEHGFPTAHPIRAEEMSKTMVYASAEQQNL